jgi:hypothetical protein
MQMKKRRYEFHDTKREKPAFVTRITTAPKSSPFDNYANRPLHTSTSVYKILGSNVQVWRCVLVLEDTGFRAAFNLLSSFCGDNPRLWHHVGVLCVSPRIMFELPHRVWLNLVWSWEDKGQVHSKYIQKFPIIGNSSMAAMGNSTVAATTNQGTYHHYWCRHVLA